MKSLKKQLQSAKFNLNSLTYLFAGRKTFCLHDVKTIKEAEEKVKELEIRAAKF